MGDVTAKVRCSAKTESGDGDSRQARVEFAPDYQDGRNREWAAATPSLSLSMTLNASAADLFTQGQAYTLTFTAGDDAE